ncbi:hypothetical protein ACFQZJ_01260 [Maribacter chungangensis]|uniref:Lipocalin-like domain-containing protein n=1 Tax=Maribacter chungangensis TaxID=1069117 RepID=A0ABW3AYA3_9FLAO
MKIIFRSAIMAALLITAACSKDDKDNTAEQAEEQAEQLENTPLEANSVSDNVIIEGGSKEMGAPPTPNGAITLDIGDTGKTAFLNEGFEISLNSNATITGAYLRFKEADGTVADSYYDIDLSANTINGKSLTISKAKKKGANLVSAKNDVTVLDIDFSTLIEPGTFCYEICVYDANGNISAPQEVCAIVGSWGGNADLVGSWDMTKQEYTEDGETTIEVLGEESCFTESVFCSNNDSFEYQECYTTELGNITFKSDGSFTTDFRGVDTEIDYEASSTQCQEVFEEDEEYKEAYKGFWAYSSTTSKLTLVAYENTYTEAGETETELLENGEGELIFDGVIQLTDTTMVISEEEDYDLDGTIDEFFKIFFEKN